MIAPNQVPDYLEVSAYPTIEELMVRQPAFDDWRYRDPIEKSFAGQLRQQTKGVEPDAFLLTADSAIPLADTIRGYYTAQGRQLPYIGYVRANQHASRIRAVGEQVRAEEIVRLTPIIGGMGCVVVMEQYAETQQTSRFAADIVRQIITETTGRGSVPRCDESNWWHDTRARDVDRVMMTSRHARQMFHIGTLAGES